MIQILAAAIGLIVELPILYFLLRKLAPSKSVVLGIVAVNLLSHPLAWTANRVMQLDFLPRVMLIELGVVFVEATFFLFILKNEDRRVGRVFLAFVVANRFVLRWRRYPQNVF